MEINADDLSVELYSVLADMLNRKNFIEVLNSVRGEYGVLKYLCDSEEGITAGDLGKALHVVPGRMADILKSLEQKELIVRLRNDPDRRVVKAVITEKGRQFSLEKRLEIYENNEELFKILGEKDTRELIRLLRIVLSYYTDE